MDINPLYRALTIGALIFFAFGPLVAGIVLVVLDALPKDARPKGRAARSKGKIKRYTRPLFTPDEIAEMDYWASAYGSAIDDDKTD